MVGLPTHVAGKGWGREGTCCIWPQAPCQPLLLPQLLGTSPSPPLWEPVVGAMCPGQERHSGPLNSFRHLLQSVGAGARWRVQQVLGGVTWEIGRLCPWSALAGQRCPTGTLWNLSSYEPLKMVIIDHGLQTLTHEVIVPHSGWEREPNEDSKPRDAEWTTVFKNTSGCLRWGWGLAQAPSEQLPWAVPGQGSRSRAPEPPYTRLSWGSHVPMSQITWKAASCLSPRVQSPVTIPV